MRKGGKGFSSLWQDRRVSEAYEMKTLVIADIGINFDGNLDKAKALIRAAKESGASIAKFQLYDVEALFHGTVMARGKNWYKDVLRTQLTKDNVFELCQYCKQVGIEFAASCFDTERLEWLEESHVKRHKLGSRYVSEELARAMKKTGKEIIASVPYGNMEEFWWRAKYADKMLYCIPEYPPEKVSLSKVDFDIFDGFSDHTPSITASLVAVARGAKVIEKHLTFDKNDTSGPDHACSITPSELKLLVETIEKIECLIS